MPKSRDQAQPKRNASWLTKALVAFHLIAITSWSLPRPPEDVRTGRRKLGIRTTSVSAALASVGNTISDGLLLFNDAHLKTSPIKLYTLSTGFWQYWDMFAPNPAATDFYGTAEVIYRDGTSRLYRYPRMYELGLGEKYLKERYRKFYERAHADSFSFLWEPFAQRIAFLSHDQPHNPPVTVKLIRHWLDIAPPGKPQIQEYKRHTYYTHAVDIGRLRGAAR